MLGMIWTRGSGSKLLDTNGNLKQIFENVNFEKKSPDHKQKENEKLPSM